MSDARKPLVIVVMGVSGAGKTTVGRQLAEELGWSFHDADDYHHAAHVALMRSGTPLSDEHRAPWLATLAELIASHTRDRLPMVLACSALRRSYRAVLVSRTADRDDVRFVHLDADPELLAERLAGRADHFFPPALLTDQLRTLEPLDAGPAALVLDAMQPVDALVALIRKAFSL